MITQSICNSTAQVFPPRTKPVIESFNSFLLLYDFAIQYKIIPNGIMN